MHVRYFLLSLLFLLCATLSSLSTRYESAYGEAMNNVFVSFAPDDSFVIDPDDGKVAIHRLRTARVVVANVFVMSLRLSLFSHYSL